MMRTLIDTGPLVAFLNEAESSHDWAVAQWSGLPAPFITCEPVLTEACFLLHRNGVTPENVLSLIQRGVLTVELPVTTNAAALETLMRRYADTPMSLADACLVRLAETYQACRVFTLDSDFTRYRRHGRQVIPLLAPW